MARFHTSVTERASFRDCRRRWDLDVNEHLARRGQPLWYLIYGDVMHAALEMFYTFHTKQKKRLTEAHAAFDAAWETEDRVLQMDFGGLYSEGIEEEWHRYREMGHTTLDYYNIFEKSNPILEEILAVNIEQRAFVRILDLSRKEMPGLPLLSGKIDLVGLKSKKDRYPTIVDHKNLATPHASRALDTDDQLTGYSYIYWRLTDQVPAALYNVLVKDPPHPPRVLKDGSLSKDKAQRTTYDLYLAAIKEHDLLRGDYGEILGYLRDKGWDQFFLREGVRRNLDEMRSFESRLFHEVQDMQRAMADPGYMYPNPGQRTCPGCTYMPLCQAMEEGGDADSVREQMYDVVEPRITIPEGA